MVDLLDPELFGASRRAVLPDTPASQGLEQRSDHPTRSARPPTAWHTTWFRQVAPRAVPVRPKLLRSFLKLILLLVQDCHHCTRPSVRSQSQPIAPVSMASAGVSSEPLHSVFPQPPSMMHPPSNDASPIGSAARRIAARHLYRFPVAGARRTERTSDRAMNLEILRRSRPIHASETSFNLPLMRPLLPGPDRNLGPEFLLDDCHPQAVLFPSARCRIRLGPPEPTGGTSQEQRPMCGASFQAPRVSQWIAAISESIPEAGPGYLNSRLARPRQHCQQLPDRASVAYQAISSAGRS